ncbi:MAG: methyl-accepting chemotaxis protein [Deltaproteobacteria bacterium]|nr:methyl-accepting chemotaxis protein [Deltaproteobacteria bacterium]
MKKRKKINLKVKRAFQKWLLLRMTAQVVLSSLMAAAILYFYARSEITDNFYTAHVTIRRVSDLLLPVIAAGSAVSFFSAIFAAAFLPQKIAGPLYCIEKRLEDLQEGDLRTEVILRRGDILQDMAAAVNHSTSALREKIIKVRKDQEQIEKNIKETREIRDAVHNLKENLDFFKI